jgi:hypothetical protein
MPHRPHTARASRFLGIVVAAAVIFTGLQSFAWAWPSLGGWQTDVESRIKIANDQVTDLHRRVVSPLWRHPSRTDSDRDGLSNWTEVNRTRTNPRKADTDGDSLSDWTETYRTKTDARKADTDSDGASDGDETAAGSDPRNPASVPTTPPSSPPPPTNPSPPPRPLADTTAPNTAVVSGPGSTTQSTSASFGFTSTEQGSTFQCRLDSAAWSSCTTPKSYSGISVGTHTFRVRATDSAGNVDATPATYGWTVKASSSPGASAIWTTPPNPVANKPVTLDGTDSTGKGPLSCTWSFENQDGSVVYQTRTGCEIEFTFQATGIKYVELNVKDSTGSADAEKKSFSVSASAPGPDTTAPNTSIASGPSSTTTSTSASFSFSSTESGSTFACRLDGSAWVACTAPKAYPSLSLGTHAFAVRATDAAGNTDASPATRNWTVVEKEEEEETPPQPNSCVSGAVKVTSTSALTSAVSSGKDACVTAALGDVNFTNMGNRSGVVVSTEGGSMGHLEIGGTTNLTIDSARFRSVTIRGGHGTVIEDSTIGGTPSNRVFDQLIFLPDTSNNVVIRNNDIGWTKADNTGNTGYGCRCYGTLNGLQFVRNKVHDIAADGFQGVGGDNVLIDRNEFGPVGANSESDEHSDNIQITFNESNLRITNNWIHHQGYFDGGVTNNAGSTYIHGGATGSLIYENNLVQINRGRTEVCGLGTGGTSRSNITLRRNTWVDGGQAFSNFPGFEWDCDSGSGNLIERNIAVDPDGGFAQNGSASAAVFASNLWGSGSLVTLNAAGNCTSANCNPAGQEPIGYRKPTGVRW